MITELRSAFKKLALIILGAVTLLPFTAFLLLNKQKVSLYLDLTPPETGTHTPDIIAPVWLIILCVFLIGTLIGGATSYLYATGFRFSGKK